MNIKDLTVQKRALICRTSNLVYQLKIR